MKTAVLLLAMAAVGAGCENVDRDLHGQISVRVGKTENILPVPGSVPVLGTKTKKDYSSVDGVRLVPPFPLDGAAAAGGKRLFDIYCSPCHGRTGKADTKIAAKMEITPTDLTGEGTKALTDGEIFIKMLTSETVMPKYRNELDDGEAWRVVAFVRSLQKNE